jgi:hypothetical protein
MANDYFLFNKYYQEIFSFDARKNKKIFLGDKINRSCRFCGKTSPEVSFRNTAHAIPELLNNRQLFSNYECDVCNNKFSETVENQLGILLTPYRAIRQLKKKGNRTVQLSKTTKLKLVNGNFIVTMPFLKDKDDKSHVEYGTDREGKVFLRVTYPVEFNPIECYMAFVKMALSIAPDTEINNLHWAIDWLNDEPHIGMFDELLVIEQVSKIDFTYFYAKLFKLNISCPFNIPTYAFVLAYQDYIFTIYLPAFGKSYDINLLKTIPWLPNLQLGSSNSGTYSYWNMNGEKVSIPYTFGYSSNHITLSIK